MGPVNTVQSSLRVYSEKSTPGGKAVPSSNDAAFVLFGFENSAHGMVSVTQASIPMFGKYVTDVTGDRGTLLLRVSDNISISGRRLGEKEAETLELPGEMATPYGDAEGGTAMLINAITNGRDGAGSFIKAVIEDTPVQPNFEESYRVQKIIDAAIESGSNGQRIRVEN